MTYTVYLNDAEEVEKKLKRLAAKAGRYGIPFSYARGEEHPQTVNVYEVDPADWNTQYVAETFTVAAVDFEVECDGFVKQAGWTVLAHIEHGDVGNIVHTFGCEADPKWFTAPARCDHCKSNRRRTVTFIVEKDGERRQVGKSCLKDYTGINPAVALMWAEVADLFPGMDCSDVSEWEKRGARPMLETEEVLAHAYDAIKADGYVKSDMPNSTKSAVFAKMSGRIEPTAEAKAQAKEIIAWLIEREKHAREFYEKRNELDKKAYAWDEYKMYCDIIDEDAHKELLKLDRAWDAPDDMERKCAPLAISGFAKESHVGLLAYMPVAYKRFMERKARNEAREAEKAALAKASEHVGEIGKRIILTAKTADLITSWETNYGYTYLYKFVDETGNVFVWFASTTIPVKAGMKIKGTVKNHTERDGTKQTVLSRCAVIA